MIEQLDIPVFQNQRRLTMALTVPSLAAQNTMRIESILIVIACALCVMQSMLELRHFQQKSVFVLNSNPMYGKSFEKCLVSMSN